MAKRRNRLHYSTGDLFAFPIDVVGGYGVAMVGRITPRARRTGTDAVEAYLFPFRWERVPTPEEVCDIKLENFVAYLVMSDYQIQKKKYPIVGRVTGVDEKSAPCPVVRRPMYWPDMSARRYFSRMPEQLVVKNRHIDRYYTIKDPAKYISKSEVKYLPSDDGLCSPQYYESLLADIIQKNHPRIFSPGAKTIEIWRRIWDQLIAEGVVKIRKKKPAKTRKPAQTKSAG